MEHIEPYIPTPYMPELEPQDNNTATGTFVETFFTDGPLGVTLRRRPEDGIVFIYEVIPNSQATSLDVQTNDELWAVGDSEIGTTPLDKEAWNGLITFIKQSGRPLRLVWRRRHHPLFPLEAPRIQEVENNAARLAELQKLVERFVVRERENYRKLFMIDPSKIPADGRRIIKQGDCVIEPKQGTGKLLTGGLNGGIWSKTSNHRRVTLCNDILIIAVPLSGNVFGVEYILELATCKLRSLGHAFGVHQDFSSGIKVVNCSFDFIYPGGELQFNTQDPSEKEVWVLNIYLAMCECVDPSSRMLGWRHQYLLGTMHSAVIQRDEDRVKELISLCDNQQLDFLSIEAPDEDSYTPLHYACMLRLHGMIKILHDATADVTAADKHGFTPLHWAALQLDDYALSLLSTHVFNIDLEDSFGRTPLVLACIEGRNISGKTDSVLVRKCIESLISHKPNLHFSDSKAQTLLHYLSASWQYDGIEALLDAGCSDVNAVDNRYFMAPLHYATNAAPIKLSVGDGMRVIANSSDVGVSLSLSESSDNQFEQRQYRGCLDTLRVLLQYGAKPNQKDIQGRTPLMIVLESNNMTKEEQEAAIAVLLSHGARVDDATNALTNNSQSVQNLLRSKFSDVNVGAFVEKWNLLPCLDCDKLNIK
jgi:ankyrin repeat protein